MFLKSVIISLASAGYQIIIIINIIIMCSPVELHVVTQTLTLFVSSCPNLITGPRPMPMECPAINTNSGNSIMPHGTLCHSEGHWHLILANNILLKSSIIFPSPCPRSPPITLFYVPQIVRKLDTWEMIELWQFSENSFGAADISCHALADVWVTK